MPFTFAHPAAAIPLLRPLRRYGVLSALVIGSVTPDLAYLLPFRALHAESHSLVGVVWFCLPIGLLSYAIFHMLLKGPLLGLLPMFMFSRLGAYVERFQSLPSVSWGAVVASLFMGAVTHLSWDAFTHQGVPAVNLFPALQTLLFSIGTYPVYLFKLLQHASTALGLLLVTSWSWQWLAKAPVNVRHLPVMLAPSSRYLVVVAVLLTSALAGLAAGLLSLPIGMLTLQVFVGKAVFSSMPALLFAVVLYSVAWHLRRLHG